MHNYNFKERAETIVQTIEDNFNNHEFLISFITTELEIHYVRGKLVESGADFDKAKSMPTIDL